MTAEQQAAHDLEQARIIAQLRREELDLAWQIEQECVPQSYYWACPVRLKQRENGK